MNDLEELKSLLFGAEKQTLDTLTERVQQPETRAADIADVLPEAVRLSHRSGPELVTELREPVGQCLKKSFHEAPHEYADALYPVMGPAIRKSISETLKAFTQQINTTMEQSLSLKYLKWRFQASRAGVPFGEFVLRQSLLYRVEQAYLISRENGLLVSHVHHDASRIKDSDAVSAMFTAIQDFVKESFSPDRSGRLEVADMGEFSLWAVHGPHALLVCVIRGVPPKALRSDISAILERIHFRYGDAIRSYSGDTSSMQDVEDDLNDCLTFQAEQPAAEKERKSRLPLIVLLLALAGVAAYFAYNYWQHRLQYNALADVTDATPGIYVSEITYADDVFVLQGLRDPLAAGDNEIATRAGLEADELTSNLRPYHSLDPAIVFLRARELLEAPQGVSVAAADDGIAVSGQAPQRWIETLQTRIDANTFGVPLKIDGLESVEWSSLEASVRELNNTRFQFSELIILREGDRERLAEFASQVGALATKATNLGGQIDITLTGSTDGGGDARFNAALSADRASVAAQALVDAGVDLSSITRDAARAAEASVTEVNPDLRRVTVNLELQR